jgi:hypothetical protein
MKDSRREPTGKIRRRLIIIEIEHLQSSIDDEKNLQKEIRFFRASDWVQFLNELVC